MALPHPSFIVGVFALLYLSSFVVFALLRIITGISIQRLGYASLRRISFSPKEGIRVDIRGLGLSLHRPTFAQPTWLSIVLTELKVTVDLKTLGTETHKSGRWRTWTNGSPVPETKARSFLETPPGSPTNPGTPGVSPEPKNDSQRSRIWERLTETKERIKRLHRKINWIRMFDLVATNTSLVIVDVGTIQVAHYTMAVDTRRKTVDRSRLFQHRRAKSANQRPAEWIINVRSILFLPEGKESTEILDNCTLNVHGLLVPELDGLRDASVALKLGRVSLPYDDIERSIQQIKFWRRSLRPHPEGPASDSEVYFENVMDELESPGSTEESIVQTVSDSKEFVSSILRGIQEVQFAISFFGMSQRVRDIQPSGPPVYLNISMKEISLDLLRLDPKSPAHLMYFSPKDVAHQALLTAISISIGIDDGEEHPERLMYVPMATATMRTTLPSKTIQFTREKNVAERNTNILFANLVVTSPSVDLDPKHLPLMLAVLQRRERSSNPKSRPNSRTRHHLISRLLPKASIKISVHEPVTRVALPPMEVEKKGTDEFDLLISAMSAMSLEIESSHSAGGDLHYALSSNFRITSHNLYYQTASGEKFNLHNTETFEIKVQVSASPDVAVIATANVQTFSIYMVRPEISEGVRQIVAQLRSDTFLVPNSSSETPRSNFLRRLPSWLQNVQVHGADFNVEVAGVDTKVSREARGLALHLESWNAEYRADKSEPLQSPTARHRAVSKSVRRGDDSPRQSSPAPPSRRRHSSATDGRRLAIHTQGLEAFVVESADTWEPESFLSLPRFEVAFTTSTDNQGPLFHVNSFARSLTANYSLYRHFAVGMAMTVLQKTFQKPQQSSARPSPTHQQSSSSLLVPGDRPSSVDGPEVTTLDFRAAFVQVKVSMPTDPPLMLQVFSVEAGRHRWAFPFLRSKLIRLYAETPNVRNVWTRVISFRSLRFDYRRARRKIGASFVEERSFDVVADATRIAIPHQLVVHKIMDNIVNVKKTVEQLHHRFQTGTDEYILEKEPEGPKHVPRISFKSSAFLFEIEDGSFEWKIGCIFRTGLEEQKQRLAREEAFRLKVKRLTDLEKNKGGGSRFRTQSAHNMRTKSPRGRIRRRHKEEPKRRSQSEDGTEREREPSPPRQERRGRRMHYDAEGTCEMSDQSHRSIDQAWDQLLKLNAQSWKRRIDHNMNFQNRGMKDIRHSFGILDDIPDDVEQPEMILAVPQRPALMAVEISDLSILIDKPSFPLNDYPEFLHRIGKGMPYDMKYGLLIPTSVQLGMGEARVTLRDYPLPLLHVPALAYGQSHKQGSLSLKADFVIAEEFRDEQSIRRVDVVVVPPDSTTSDNEGQGYTVNVRRTIAAIKTYSDIAANINTSNPTKITWGVSYQPAIQDTMQVIESFTKPAVDPSERVGFWDKIRLSFHSRVKVAWAGDGDVHLILKGTRDPYDIIGDGAGFVMCWRKNVLWNICQDPDPKNFMTVDSDDYVLAIPDANFYVRNSLKSDASDTRSSLSGSSSGSHDKMFQKTVMKLHGNVRWSAGLVFERNTDSGGRSFEFLPHYQVVLKNPKYAKPHNGRPYDAFRGFRSHHIHMSVGIAAPVDRDWSVTNLEPSTHYNSVHLTPLFFSHFFSWWKMFSGAMSLPVHQGKIWPGPGKSSKKFGRHLATIKYSLLFSPLYLSHIYKHKESDELGQGKEHATGLKTKLDSFMLDLHQRREVFRTQVEGVSKTSKTSAIKINQAQLDLIGMDTRAVSAVVDGPGGENMDEAAEETQQAYAQQGVFKLDLSRFTIPDEDPSWIDMDDFVELDDLLPAGSSPEVQILPLAYAPRFTYFRQTDHGNVINGDPGRSSPFGNEPTHFCVMTTRNDPRLVQCRLIQDRVDRIDEQIAHNKKVTGKHELEAVRDTASQTKVKESLEHLNTHAETLQMKKDFLLSMLKTLRKRLDTDDHRAIPDENEEERFFEAKEYDLSDDEAEAMDSSPIADYVSDFNNRFVVHNVQLKWTNSLRNIILRYIHQVSQRRGFVYYMSRSSVKFILDIIEEQKKNKAQTASVSGDPARTPSVSSPTADEEIEVQDRIQQLLEDGKKFVQADDPAAGDGHKPGDANAQNISHDFTAQNSYFMRLIAPQIQLQSEKSTKNAVLVTAKGMQLKIIQIMDKDRVADEISGLVQRRFFGNMENLQMFATNSSTFGSEYLHMYSGNKYGAPAGSAWPPWVPLEVMFDFKVDPYGFNRVVQRTSATLRYDKYNTLRLKYNDDVSKEQSTQGKRTDSLEERIDHLWIEFPHVRAICDSGQYYALYIIVLDLLLYSEPLEKTRNERLEKIMLASDFSDLTGAPEMVIRLQERIRQMEELKLHFQLQEKALDRQGWKERIVLEHDLAACEDELFFIMKAITTSQRKYEDRAQASQSTGLLRWYISASELVWHLIRGQDESLVELQLKDAIYDRTDNTDGSNHNIMEIGSIHGLNLLPSAIYPEMIAPFFDEKSAYQDNADMKMLRIQWLMLEAIAGIPVMDHFEINVYPLRIQLEHDVGVKLFEYVFPGVGHGNFGDGGFSPFMVKHALPAQQETDEDDTTSVNTEGLGSPALLFPESATSTPKSVEQSPAGDDLALRLQPTLTLNEHHRPKSSGRGRFGRSSSHTDLTHLGRAGMRKSLLRRDLSSEALSSRPGSNRTVSNFSATKPSAELDRSRRFSVARSNSGDKQQKKKERSDDLAQMLYRASNYMTLAYVKIPSMVLCLSYKGKGQRNIEDVHDLVFRMPTLEYRNKTWSNLDLFLQLKKEVTRALVAHIGTIIGNKFSHHRPNKQQQTRLREIANSSTLLGAATPSEFHSNNTSESNSMRDDSPNALDEPRRSFAESELSRELSREISRSVSHNSSASEANGVGLGLIMRDRTERNGSVTPVQKTSDSSPPTVVVEAAVSPGSCLFCKICTDEIIAVGSYVTQKAFHRSPLQPGFQA
ncbi:hypothetical protein NA57DRAFT_32900 [Rhizodiscina lignyota]|uniref:Uncharacterized protein n=1 Tax=Rhizodiscina lignyota TaxID=1504668 RepID=A0A9P4INI0_9PEZI|nr:hypothetical protein NA57DRAFT_32900 [Rhizodiscina lignyota]